ncbi:MAG: hypothetical protein VX223_07945 [Myxococcota bacterium]|nr:hypothetical protein [Myxococcota bacterium]
MGHEQNPRDAPRHRLSHAIQQRIAKKTIMQSLGGVSLLVVTVFTLTGRCAENPNALRRLQTPVKSASADWVKLSVDINGFRVPFVLSVPLEAAQEGAALPEGLIVNGLEEIPVGVRRTSTGFEVPMLWLGATLTATWVGDEEVEGEWRRRLSDGSFAVTQITGFRIPDALPERRYPVAPAIPAAEPTRQPLPTRYAVTVGGATGVLRYRKSTTHAIDATVYVAGRSYGALAGSLHGRFLQASHFDGREATLLQATCSEDGMTLQGFISINGDVLSFTGKRLEQRLSVPQQQRLTEVEQDQLKISSATPAVVWHTSTLNADSHRVARGLAELLKPYASSVHLHVYLHEPAEGSQARRSAWLTYYGLNADVTRLDTPNDKSGTYSAIAFVRADGSIHSAYQGSHGPDTGGSYRKLIDRWADEIRSISGAVATPNEH